MANADCEIGRATRDDIAGIVALQELNLRENGGTLSVRFSREWFEGALSDMPVLVARRAGQIVGYLISSSKAAQSQASIIQAMLRAYPGADDAYLYGPICIAESQRGKDLLAALHTLLPGREGITFIRKDNVRSMRAHAKIGMREVAEFSHDGAAIVVVVSSG